MGRRLIPALLLVFLLTTLASPWNTGKSVEQKGPIRVAGQSGPAGNISYFADLMWDPGSNSHFRGHAYIIEHAIRLLRADGFPNWADFAQNYLLHLTSGAFHADAYKGRVKICFQLEGLLGLFSTNLYEFDLTCAGGCEHYHNVSDGSGLDLTWWNFFSELGYWITKVLTTYASKQCWTWGMVNLTVEVEPDIRSSYPSGADLCAEHYANAVETWRNGKVSYPARSQRESAMYELGWACHLLADLTVSQHLYGKFIGGHASYEDFADGLGDDASCHAKKGDFLKHFGGHIPAPRQLAEQLARTLRVQHHPENFQQAEHGGEAERKEAVRLALPLAERYTAALLARFMTEIGVPKTVPPLRGYVSVKGSAEKIPGAFVYYSPVTTIEQNVDIKDVWQGWDRVRADSRGMYSIPVLGHRKYLVRAVMPGYGFDGTTDAPSQEFASPKCPVEYFPRSGVLDADMLNLYMDPLPRLMKAVIKLPGQAQAKIDAGPKPGLLSAGKADLVPAGAHLARSGTRVSPALAKTLTSSLLEVECSRNVLGVRGNDIGLPDEALLTLHVFNYLDLANGQVARSAADIQRAVDGFRFEWKSAGLPMTAAGSVPAGFAEGKEWYGAGLGDRYNLLELRPMLHSRQSASPEGGTRTIYSFAPPYADGAAVSRLVDNGLGLVPAAAGTEIEVSTIGAPGCLLAPSDIRVTTNKDGRAAFKVKAGSHAGNVRLQVKVVRNPAAPQVLPAESLEIAIQPRIRGADPKPESHLGLEPAFLMTALQAVPLTPGPRPEVLRTSIQVGDQGIMHEGRPLVAGLVPPPAAPAAPVTAAPAEQSPFAAVRPQTVDISGTWKSNIGLVYRITQTGNSFTWEAPLIGQKARGTISGTSIVATWTGPRGKESEPTPGTIILDEGGRAVRIEWSNKVVFRR